MAEDLEMIAFKTPAEFEKWLKKEHAREHGLWVMFAKKASGIETMNYAQALDVALCYGWIDGHVKRYDDDYYIQRWTPRRKRSKWSKINRDHVARLIEEGRMQPAGQAQIDAAKADGRWDAAYSSPANAKVQPDFQAALDKEPKAAEKWDSLSKSARYTILYQLEDAKKPETRARRIDKYIGLLREGKGPYD
jgi:uncharacterized protein YdeI (YjbR/CyaY-like superfamily)